jgi:hypothetical protein
MSRIALSIALALALLTGIVVALLGDLSKSVPATIQAADPASAHTATTFYEAINHLLASGDDLELRRLLHPDFINHGAVDTSAAAMVDDLRSLRSIDPQFRVRTAGIRIGGDLALVTIDPATPGSGTFLGMPVTGPGLFADHETIRIEDAMVIERWGPARASSRFTTYPSISIPADRLATGALRLERLTFDAHAESSVHRNNGLLLIVESGVVSISMEGDPDGQTMLHRLRSDRQVDASPLESDRPRALLPGDLVVLPASAGYRLWNDTSAATSVLSLEIHHSSPASLEMPATSPGVARELVAASLFLLGTGQPDTLQIGQATLAPGAGILRHTVAGSELIFLTSGSIDVKASTSGIFTAEPDGKLHQIDTQIALPVRRGLATNHDSEISYQVSSDQPATIWFFNVSPQDHPSAP